MTGFIKENLASGEYTLSAFLDIEGAFNNVATSSIGNLLRAIHAADSLVRFIIRMFGNRLIRSKLGGCPTVKSPTRDTPQGGAISSFVGLGC